jgi:hypothetical protein
MTRIQTLKNIAPVRRWRTFSSMDRVRKRLLIEALILQPAISCGFKLIGVTRTQSCLRRWASTQTQQELFRLQPKRGITLALWAQRLAKRKRGGEGTCLIRSLALWATLLRRGVETQLRVGLRSNEGKVEAHAWLEFAGEPINESVGVVRTYQAYPRPMSFDGWREWLRKSH